MATELDLAKRALAHIGTRTTITSLDDTSKPEAVYAKLLLAPIRDFMLREGDYDFSMQNIAAVASTGAVSPWTHAWEHPTNALRIRQCIPTVFTALDPRPVEWNVINIGGTKRIVTKESIARLVITDAPTNVDNMDAMFQESFVRFLGSALAFALENRIEASKQKLEEALSFAGVANLRDG